MEGREIERKMKKGKREKVLEGEKEDGRDRQGN